MRAEDELDRFCPSCLLIGFFAFKYKRVFDMKRGSVHHSAKSVAQAT